MRYHTRVDGSLVSAKPVLADGLAWPSGRLAVASIFFLAVMSAQCSDDSSGLDASTSSEKTIPSDVRIDASIRDAAVDRLSTEVKPRVKFCGQIRDDQNALIPNAGLIICNGSECLKGTSDASGEFCMSVDTAADYLFHVPERTINDKHYGDIQFPISVSAQDLDLQKTVDLGTLYQPLMGPAVTLDPGAGGSFSLGQGVTLTVAPGITELPKLKTQADVAFARISIEHVHPRLLGSVTGRPAPVAAFLIVPVGVNFTSPVLFSLSGWSLGSNTTFDLLWANADTGKLQIHSPVASDAQGVLAPDTGGGLSALGWFVLYPR